MTIISWFNNYVVLYACTHFCLFSLFIQSLYFSPILQSTGWILRVHAQTVVKKSNKSIVLSNELYREHLNARQNNTNINGSRPSQPRSESNDSYNDDYDIHSQNNSVSSLGSVSNNSHFGSYQFSPQSLADISVLSTDTAWVAALCFALCALLRDASRSITRIGPAEEEKKEEWRTSDGSNFIYFFNSSNNPRVNIRYTFSHYCIPLSLCI